MAEPASLAARYALLAEWKAQHDPRAELIEKQLAYRQYSWNGRRGADARALKAEINQLVKTHGRAWAGRVAELVEDYTFHRGLVAEIKLSGEAFLRHGQELLSLAPIQHVDLVAPIGSIEAIAASPLLAKLSSLHIDAAGAAVGDQGAIALANSPHVANLVELSLWNDDIGRAGAEALAASPYLANARYVGLVGNPADATPFTREESDGSYTANRPGFAIELEQKHGPRPWLAAPSGHLPSWPGERDELALIRDHVSDGVLAELEKLALEVDALEAGSDDDRIRAGAKRQRLLIELDVGGLLTGKPASGDRLAGHPTLRGYHDACVQMASYHASAARIRLVGKVIPIKPTEGHVSLDWFRTPSGYTPAGVSAHDWLALCEANFLAPMPTGTGTRFVRLEGKIHVLSYRIEATAEPRLWRAQPA